jgi:hypothetical protein
MEIVFVEIGNGSVSRLQGRAGGVEVAREGGREERLRVDSQSSDQIVPPQRLAHIGRRRMILRS